MKSTNNKGAAKMTTTKITSLTDEEITALAEKAMQGARTLPANKVSDGWRRIDELCLSILDALGVESGDLAAMYWDGVEHQFGERWMVERYIRAELRANAEEIEDERLANRSAS